MKKTHVSREEMAAGVVATALLHARGHCLRSERGLDALYDIYEELTYKRAVHEVTRDRFVRAELATKAAESLDRAVFRHVLRETGDAQLAERAVGVYTRALGGSA